MSIRQIYLLMAVLGTVVPMSAFIPWLIENGFAPLEFVQAMFANRISAFFSFDVLISGVVVLLALCFAKSLQWRSKVLVALATCLIGVSAGLPLFFFFRETKPDEVF
ncbi:DUF2834 domain-containing protein [Terasakiella pusilla]|uniref:DUF2834 domain-containing protein n=1 Tax=Terasakiella pusilla TaxID=64973 RepID=UPI003AA89659